MCLVRINIRTLTSFDDWEQLYLLNYSMLNNFSVKYIYSDEVKCEELYYIGVILHNLGRFTESYCLFLKVLAYTKVHQKVQFLNEIGDILAADHVDNKAIIFYQYAIELMHEMKTYNKSTMLYCLKKKQICEDNLKIRKIDPHKEIVDYLNDKSTRLKKLFYNFDFFENEMNMNKFIIEEYNAEKFEYHMFAKTLIQNYDFYKSTCSSFLAAIFSNGVADSEKCLNTIFNFVSNLQVPKILIQKVMYFSSIDRIVNENLLKYPDIVLENKIKAEDLIDKCDDFLKNHTFLKALGNYSKCCLIRHIKRLMLYNTDKTFIICDFETLAEFCFEQIKMLQPSLNFLNKKREDKKHKLLKTYSESLPEYKTEIVKVGILSIYYVFLIYKEDEGLISYCQNIEERKIKLKAFKKIIFLLNFFQIFCSNLKIDMGDNFFFAKLNAFLNETLSFLDPLLLVSEMNNGIQEEFRKTNKFYNERLLSNYLKLLETTFLDDPNNVRIIDNLMYGILFQGGYTVSIIWALYAFKEFANTAKSISLISSDIYDDTMLSMMFGRNFEKYKNELDMVVKKIVKLKKFPGKNMEDGVIDADFVHPEISYQQQSHNLILPQLIINSEDELVFLPEFCNFIQDGNKLRVSLIKENDIPNDSASSDNKEDQTHAYDINTAREKINPNTYIKLKSIIKPKKESIFECLKKSNTFLTSLINNPDIPLMNEMKKTKNGRQQLYILNGDIFQVHIPASYLNTNIKYPTNKFGLNKSSKTKEWYDANERVQIFKQKILKNKETSAIRTKMWEELVDIGISSTIEIN